MKVKISSPRRKPGSIDCNDGWIDSGLRRNDVFYFFLILVFVFSFPASAQDLSADAMAALQGRLVGAANDIRGIERQLQGIEDHLADLAIHSASLEQEYNQQRAHMASTLVALTRMSRTPREAILIRPGGPLQAARTSMLLSASIPAIEREAASFKNLLTELEKTRRELNEKAAQAKTARADLAKRHERLSTLLDDRRRASSRQAIIWSNAAREAADLARDAKSLRDLLGAMDADKTVAIPDSEVLAAIPDSQGQLPVSGIIRVRYGQKDSAGDKSNGLSIETLTGSLVVAPLGGIVRYAGPFKGYGNIVIIAHPGGYHSLIAGLDKINVLAGQTIVSGEPIAILGASGNTNQFDAPIRKTVYYELRQGGVPVNPSRKLPDLG